MRTECCLDWPFVWFSLVVFTLRWAYVLMLEIPVCSPLLSECTWGKAFSVVVPRLWNSLFQQAFLVFFLMLSRFIGYKSITAVYIIYWLHLCICALTYGIILMWLLMVLHYYPPGTSELLTGSQNRIFFSINKHNVNRKPHLILQYHLFTKSRGSICDKELCG